MHNFALKLGIALTGLLSANIIHADTKKLFSETTEHYYQLFETSSLTWPDAKAKCEDIGAHLVTITSPEEQAFINHALMAKTSGYYFMGGTDAAKQTEWQWITGEKWSYQIWSTGGDNGPQPSSRPDEDYLLIGPNLPNNDIAWFDINSTTPDSGYICEWSTNKEIATAIVPDINKNGASEIAVLAVDYKTGKQIVQINDSDSKKLLNTLNFATDATHPPQGLVVLKDLNNNGISEIGVLYKQKEQPAVLIKDAKPGASGPLLKTLVFFNATYRGKAVTVSPDCNGNGADKITLLAQHKATLASLTETRDSKTGAILKKLPFSSTCH